MELRKGLDDSKLFYEIVSIRGTNLVTSCACVSGSTRMKENVFKNNSTIGYEERGHKAKIENESEGANHQKVPINTAWRVELAFAGRRIRLSPRPTVKNSLSFLSYSLSHPNQT